MEAQAHGNSLHRPCASEASSISATSEGPPPPSLKKGLGVDESNKVMIMKMKEKVSKHVSDHADQPSHSLGSSSSRVLLDLKLSNDDSNRGSSKVELNLINSMNSSSSQVPNEPVSDENTQEKQPGNRALLNPQPNMDRLRMEGFQAHNGGFGVTGGNSSPAIKLEEINTNALRNLGGSSTINTSKIDIKPTVTGDYLRRKGPPKNGAPGLDLSLKL
ncbi:hypothetical protein CFP56_005507 [Quercus suber]|uniref:Uncharacterized protein n=1 Tax=Quercus suber TaxID=58331 RepID=A0AAW0LCW3_QUESU